MSLPTLMIKGKLVPPNGDPKLQPELDEWVPVEYVINWFRTRMSKTGIENRVLILKSETASGKSTMFPPELYKALVRGTGDHAPGIICTQPRVLTAIENVTEMLKHYSKILRAGETIGWSTKHNKLRPKYHGLLSATIGTLAQQLRTLTDEEIIAKYRFILIDETHERDLQTDMTIYMLKNLLERNKNNINCPFVALMSATFEPQSFIEYFGLKLTENFIWCRGETAGFDEMWDWNESRTVNNYTQAAAIVVEKIITENPNDDPSKADILIFMPGKAEFKETAKYLQAVNEKLAADSKTVFSLIQIDGPAVNMQSLDFKKLTQIPVRDHETIIRDKKYIAGRRVIITTNVAETGLTLENLKYVIDGGYNREIEFNPVLGIRGLITKPAPKSRIRQRKGRAGRKFRGVFYPLYPQHIYDKLPELQFPQILIEDVSGIIVDIINEQLKVKKLAGERDPEFMIADIDMVDTPSPDALALSIEKLYSLGLLSVIAPSWDPDRSIMLSAETSDRFSLTKLGLVASIFSMMTPESARMILASYSWGASILDVVTLAAYLTLDVKSLAAPQKPGDKINWTGVYKSGLRGWPSTGILYKIRLLIADDFINGIILFNAVKHIIADSEPKSAISNLRAWCEQNYISYRAVLDFIRARDDIIEQMLAEGMEVFMNEESSLMNTPIDEFMNTITKLKYCIYDGYRGNMLTRDGEKYKTSNGLEVTKPKVFQDDEKKQIDKSEYGFVLDALPTIILYKELNLKYNTKTFAYDVITDRISTMDSFVNVDAELLI